MELEIVISFILSFTILTIFVVLSPITGIEDRAFLTFKAKFL